jgi:hypothetical protein
MKKSCKVVLQYVQLYTQRNNKQVMQKIDKRRKATIKIKSM